MKKAKVLLAGVLCGALLFSFAACGGGGNATLDGFTRAMRSLDMEKAASYCVDADSFEDTDPAMEMAVEFTDIIDGETEDVKKFCEDLLKECMRGLEYTVDSEEENADGTQKTLQLICSNYNSAGARHLCGRHCGAGIDVGNGEGPSRRGGKALRYRNGLRARYRENRIGSERRARAAGRGMEAGERYLVCRGHAGGSRSVKK